MGGLGEGVGWGVGEGGWGLASDGGRDIFVYENYELPTLST